jgi:hypothetical protein
MEDITENLLRQKLTLDDLRQPPTLGSAINYWLTRAGTAAPFHVTSPWHGVAFTVSFSVEALRNQCRLFRELERRCTLSVGGFMQARARREVAQHDLTLQAWNLNGDFGLEFRLVRTPDDSMPHDARLAFYRQLIKVCRLEQVLKLVEVDEANFAVEALDPQYRFHVVCSARRGDRQLNPTAISIFGFRAQEDVVERLYSAVEELFFEIECSTLSLGGFALEEYETLRPRLNDITTGWEYRFHGGYLREFNVFAPELAVPENDPLRLPLLYKEDKLGGPALQVDVVHTPGGAFLEFQSTKGREFLQQVAENVGVEVEFWEGPPHLRWDGKGGA